MNKILLGVSTLILAVGFMACQSTNQNAQTAKNADANTAVASQPQENAASPQTRKPEFQVKAESMAATTVDWASEVFEFPVITEGEKVTHQFKFKNTGENPLVITHARASCGCTVPAYSEDPVQPGEEGFIDVTFNSKGKTGQIQKSITVTGNFEGNIRKVLMLRGEVTPAPAQ